MSDFFCEDNIGQTYKIFHQWNQPVSFNYVSLVEHIIFDPPTMVFIRLQLWCDSSVLAVGCCRWRRPQRATICGSILGEKGSSFLFVQPTANTNSTRPKLGTPFILASAHAQFWPASVMLASGLFFSPLPLHWTPILINRWRKIVAGLTFRTRPSFIQYHGDALYSLVYR